MAMNDMNHNESSHSHRVEPFFFANMIPAAAEAGPSPQRCPATVWTKTRCDDHRDDVGGTQRLLKRFDNSI
jgi:hypothetical protein